MARLYILMSALLGHSLFGHPSFAVTHKLQYFYTAVTPGMNFPEYTDVGLVDGEPFVYYDSNIRKYSPKTEWIKKITDSDADYWNSGTQDQQDAEEIYKEDVVTLMKRFNQTEGVHTLQRLYGCEIDDDGTVRGYDQLGYDGEDFISLDLKTVTWTAAKPQAVINKYKLDATGTADFDKYYLENICIEWLLKYVSYSREILERKDRPEVSVFQKHSSPEVVCHATGFFPKSVNITWQKDGEDVYEDVELSETLPNHDGSFQERSVLKVPAEALQKHTYTCVVQHSSLEEEIVMPVSQILRGGRVNVVFGIVFAAAVVLVAVVGILIWKKKKSGFKPITQNMHSSEEESLKRTRSLLE
ncbi:BOLA class I histocompatibility antigen, alpha chain BL3-7-like [Neoarius graeffei]|uniref:BOLA class I histocompatibility antigen, alpha chain BL3-7-like n=1 Tax=Neoarius graeffei TaxID=443677 RepID=UPI00298D2F64|nr:BOLA class I histocompatibility antigen, alpha chain BL3-7-like [Neoarius graeffei]